MSSTVHTMFDKGWSKTKHDRVRFYVFRKKCYRGPSFWQRFLDKLIALVQTECDNDKLIQLHWCRTNVETLTALVSQKLTALLFTLLRDILVGHFGFPFLMMN